MLAGRREVCNFVSRLVSLFWSCHIFERLRGLRNYIKCLGIMNSFLIQLFKQGVVMVITLDMPALANYIYAQLILNLLYLLYLHIIFVISNMFDPSYIYVIATYYC